ncbi:MAG: hypothetical protein E7647_07355 [Ruminococcaceae bacterium]|nr:hypothetical protein [Oscillospiraceae bacterium]
MEFYTSYFEKRPVRLSDKTRLFAYRSLHEHKYGLETRSVPFVSLDNYEKFSLLSDIEKYDTAIYEIAKNAPIRICEGELLSTAATLGDAIDHAVPARYNGEQIFGSISHLTIDFSKVLKIGLNGIRSEAEASLKKHTDPEKIRFIESALHCIRCFELWRDRYLDELSKISGTEKVQTNLSRVPMEPAKGFYDAVQSIWSVFAFVRLCGNWPGIGRIDCLLGEYLENDLENGIITIDEAREILAHFFIKGCEWVCGGNYISGDAQHYQNIVLAGVDENGNDAANAVTYLVLDIIEELGISDFPTSVRISEKTDKSLIRRVCEVMRFGGGVLAVYNDDLIVNALCDYGYPINEARTYANDGCWEVQIPGKTYFRYHPFDALALLQRKTLYCYETKKSFKTFESLYSQYISDIRDQVEEIYKAYTNGEKRYGWNESVPCTVISLFEDSCIEKGISYCDGGASYTVVSPHIGGVGDVANNLYAIKKLVYDEKRTDLSSLLSVLKNNWEGNEELRQVALKCYRYYGNDNDEVDLLLARIISDFCDACNSLEGRSEVRFPAGVSTFGRQIDWADSRFAGANGTRAGEVLSNNMSPAPKTALYGATAIINSHCKSDLSRVVNGAALDIRLLPTDVKGEKGLLALEALILGFICQGGFFLQIDVADPEILRKAQRDPDSYPTLSVRIAGWNARFVTLSREWQDMIIDNIKK